MLNSALDLGYTSRNSNSTSADTDVDGNDSEADAECLEDACLDADCLEELLEEQQQAWEDATNTDKEVCLDPTHPIDEQMLCDIKAITTRLASKSLQLIGNIIPM